MPNPEPDQSLERPERQYAEREIPFTRSCRYLVEQPDTEAKSGAPGPLSAQLLCLHGMGMTASGFARVLRHLPNGPRRLVVPEGPYPFEQRAAGGIKVGHAWYIYRGDQDEFREHLLRSEAHLLALLDEADPTSEPRLPTVALGFSQGGYLAGFLALRHPDRFSGLVISSARLKHEFLESELDAGKLPHTVFLHSKSDRAIDWRMAEDGVNRLRAAGGEADLILHDGGHRLPASALVELDAWLRRHDW